MRATTHWIYKKTGERIEEWERVEELYRQDHEGKFDITECWKWSKNDGCEEITNYYSSPQERQRQAVYATGNKWAIENWNATHN